MKLLQSSVLRDNKLNCSKATQVLGGPTQILIWGSEIAKGPKNGPAVVTFVWWSNGGAFSVTITKGLSFFTNEGNGRNEGFT